MRTWFATFAHCLFIAGESSVEDANNGYLTGGFPAKKDDDEPTTTLPSFRNGAATIPDIASTGRNLWDSAKEARMPATRKLLRSSDFDKTACETWSVDQDNYPAAAGLQPPGHDLAGISDIDYRRFDLDYADSDLPATAPRK